MTLHEYFGDWLKVIDLKELNQVLRDINSINKELLCPNYSDIFKSFNICNYNDLKVVMIGQDPYPQKNIATGILFGNNNVDEDSLSPSLKIIKEASIDFEIPHNSIIFDNTLESWSSQGILMLNSALTCEVNKIGSHIMLWRSFIINLLKNLSELNSGIIYVLFGDQAKTFKPYINKYTNTILEEKHPAYYARLNTKMPSSIFKEVDKLIKDKYGEQIKWFNDY